MSYSDFDKTEFLRMANAYILHYSENEAANLFDYFVDMFYRVVSASKDGVVHFPAIPVILMKII